MGCGGSKGQQEKISMQMTKLAEVDEFFNDTQGVIDNIYELKDPIDEAREDFMESTGFDEVCCGNTQHATLGTVYAIYATSKAVDDAVNAVDITMDSPFLTFSDDKVAGTLAQDTKNFTAYVNALINGSQKVLPLVDKVKTIAEKAPDLPQKSKDALSNSQGLGAMDK